tara:strand:+ start:236 stop:610 length:375 start_codon:yes stop_codon:yes gene_type:complete
MPKKRLAVIAEEYDVPFEEAFKIAIDRLPPDEVTDKGKLTWIGEDRQLILEKSMLINEITPKNYKGKVISECPNPRYNYVQCKELRKRIPVLIPARNRGKMLGKLITFEAIEDNNGASYRYIRV